MDDALASATALTAERQDRNLQSATTSPPSQPIALNDSLPTTDNTIKANRTPESIVDGFLRANDFKTIKDTWKNGETPLQIACVRVYQDKDNITLIKALVSLGANVDANDHSGETPLQAAVLAGSLEAVELLVAHGAHVNQADREGKTALFACASSRSNGVEIAKLLVNRGASMSVRDSDGRTPLHLAALHYATDLVRFYLSQKIDLAAVDTKGRTALHNAASKGERDAVISLIEAGADPGVRDLAGEKPAYLAAGGGHGSLAEALASADRARNGRVRVAHSSQSFAQVTNPPESVLRSYLDAKQWPDKLPFVRSPSRVEPLMRQYYSEGYEGGQSTMGKLETDAVGNSFIEVKFAKGGQSRFYVTLVDGKCLVDWEASVGWSDMSGVAFQAKKPPFPVNMRGIAKLDSFYNPLSEVHKDGLLWTSVRFWARDGETFNAYAKRHSVVGEGLDAWLENGQQRRTSLAMTFRDGDIEIVGMTPEWVFPVISLR